jgi:membrane-associated phospholipid phosphatase
MRTARRQPDGVRRWIALTTALLLLSAACGGSPAATAEAPVDEPGTWATWVLTSPSEIDVPPPPAAGSPAAEADLAALRDRADLDDRAAEVVRRWDTEPALTPWMELALDFIANRTKDPVAASRSYALVSVAMYDAVVATWHHQQRYRRPGPQAEVPAGVASQPDPSYPSGHAAIAGAASTVLATVFPEQPALRLHALAEEAAQSRVLAGVSFPSDVEAGLALGRAVGTLVLERTQVDVVTDADVALREGAANWEELRPDGALLWRHPRGSVQVPVSPMAGTWRTWVLESGDQLRPGPFPDVASEQFRAEALEVAEVQRNLTPEQLEVARFWEGGEGTALPPGIWNEVALAFLAHQELSLPRAARALALLNVAMDDAGVAAWDAKYAYWGPRPDTAIHDLGIDPDWEPALPMPIFPGYVSGHGAYSGAAEVVMSYLFPDHAELFTQRAEEASMSRLYAGIHMRSDNEVGLDLGRAIGALVVDRARQDGADS